MNNLLPRATHFAAASDVNEARTLFENRRLDLLAAYRALCQAGADRAEAAAEAVATANAMLQLLTLEGRS